MPSLHVLSVTYNRRQDVKRDYTTYLAFAEAFKSLLERRRRRKAMAFDREIDGQARIAVGGETVILLALPHRLY